MKEKSILLAPATAELLDELGVGVITGVKENGDVGKEGVEIVEGKVEAAAAPNPTKELTGVYRS